MQIKKIIFVYILIIFAVTQVQSGSNSTFDFLRNDVSARAAALGGSFVTFPNDPNTIFYNPSALATINHNQVSIGFFKHLLDINSGHLSYAQYFEGFGFFGAGIIYTDYGDFEWRNDLGDNIGNFSANEFALVGGYANELIDNLNYGANIKFIYSSIASYNSYAFAADFGLLYTVIPERFSVGASVLHLGTQIDPYINTKENLPVDLKIGASVKPEHLPLLMNLSFHKLTEKEDDFISRFKAFSIGGEFTISPNVQVRFGYNNEERQDFKIGKSSGLAGFSFGGGFLYDIFRLDYAFNSMGKIGALHRISFGILM